MELNTSLFSFIFVQTIEKKDKVTMSEQKTTTSKARSKNIAKDMKISPDKIYEFQLLKVKKGNTLISRESETLDDETGKKRYIKFNPQFPESPYLDDQIEGGYDQDFETQAPTILFASGILRVKGYDEALIRYLMAHDGNEERKKTLDNRTVKFKLMDYEKIAEDKLAIEDSKLDAKLIVRQAVKEGDKKLDYFMLSNFGIERGEEDKTFQTQALQKAEEYHELFNKEFNNDFHKLKYDIIKAFDEKILSVTARGEVSWSATKTLVNTFEKGESGYAESIATWVKKGNKGTKEFQEKLEKELSSK